MSAKREFRFLQDAAIELRATGEGDAKTPVITGYAAVFNSPAEIFGFREVIKPGAFTRTLKEKADVRALIDHDPSLILGRSKSGTLRMSEDSRGLRVEIDPPDTQVARDTMASMRRGDLDQMSFGFRVKKENWQYDKSDDGKRTATRELLDVDLFDVSVVTYPAYEATSVQVRSLFPDGEITPPPDPEAEVIKPLIESEVIRLHMRQALAEREQ